MPRAKPDEESEKLFFKNLYQVTNGQTRRIDFEFTDCNGDKGKCSIYRCTDNLVRSDFNRKQKK